MPHARTLVILPALFALGCSDKPTELVESAPATPVVQASAPESHGLSIPEQIDALAIAFRTTTQPVREVDSIAPLMCAPPQLVSHPFEDEWLWTGGVPGRDFVNVSEAGTGTPHGRKIYKLRATDPQAYLEYINGERDDLPDGFAVMKESWHGVGDPQTPETLRRGPEAPLFVMSYHGSDYTGGDEGWLYSTYDPVRSETDGEVVGWEMAISGRIASCMACHANAEHGRLFGLSGHTLGRPTLGVTNPPRARQVDNNVRAYDLYQPDPEAPLVILPE